MLFTSLLLLGAMVIGAVRYVSAASAPFVSIPNTVAPEVTSAKVTGPAAASQKLQLSVSLRSKNETGLRDYAGQVSQPKSKLYHQYLTPSQFATVFGADHNALSATEQYLQQQGLHLDNCGQRWTSPHLLGHGRPGRVGFQSPHQQLHAPMGAHSTPMPTVCRCPRHWPTRSSTSPAWRMPASGIPIRPVAPKAATMPATTTKSPKASISVTCPSGPTVVATGSTKSANGLLPANLQTVYNFPAYANSPGNNVWAAMVELDGYQVYDLQQYEICAGINGTIQAATGNSPSSSNPFIINQNLASSPSTTPAVGQNYGTPLPPGNYAASVTGELEALIGLAPYLQHISVIQNNNTTQGLAVALSTIANEDAAQVVDIPWGMCEADVGFANASTEEYSLMQMALQGQSVFASTGDYGLYACDGDGTLSVSTPSPCRTPRRIRSSRRWVVRSLASPVQPAHLEQITGWSAEQPWNNYPQNGTNVPTLGQGFLGGAGGGGISQFWAAPSWQQNADAAYSGADPNTGHCARRCAVATTI